ncbi:ATP-binding protein (plasmid) [Deinococcus taeanensis]|uniref:ATP-binding protein n=1 Tax=Deinococcus taeanensis TaxID=2737050 RepID=UPI001CDBC574|nr:ATP-binding protein [Deinococcus taeanensis]UBV44957.1 ATP-binding protein [Deinococcus taeanensis]
MPAVPVPELVTDSQALRAACDQLSAQVLDVALSEQAEPDVRYVVPLPEEVKGTRLGGLQARLALSEFEAGVVALALATELFPDRMLSACAAALQVDGMYSAFLTPSLARRWLLGDEWTEAGAFQPDRPLVACHLLEFGTSANASVLEALVPVRLSAGALAFLRGEDTVAPEVRTVLGDLPQGGVLSPSQDATLRTLRRHLDRGGNERAALLYGPNPGGAQSLAAHLLAPTGQAALLDVGLLGTRPPEEQDVALRVLKRETHLRGIRLVVDATAPAPEGPGPEVLVDRVLTVAAGPVVVIAPDPLPLTADRAVLSVEVQPPTPAEQRERWMQALNLTSQAPLLRELGDQFQLSLEQIDRLAREARAALPANAGQGARLEAAWEAARGANRRLMGALAQRVDSRASWDDLVLPDADRMALQQIAAHVRHRSQVYEELGLARPGRGRSITALFSGPSGTGKTLSAEVLARELNLDLYRVDLSSTVSKYIGETEKNLKRIFDAADQGGCVLLFDEADSVFGKRGEVRDSNDRYANTQVNYLLQRLETFNGLAVLTTNLESSMDVAFMRRLQFVINFRAPQAAERERLWRGAFPATLETCDVDFARLAQAEVAGGNIRSVAMNAVFMAVARSVPLTQALVEEALHLEYRKLGRLVL